MIILPAYPKPRALQSAADLWRILAVSDGYIYSHGPLQATAICYFPALYLKSREILEAQQDKFIRSFFALPIDTQIGTYLLKYPRGSGVTPFMKSPHATLNYMEKKRVEAINAYPTPEYSPFISISVPVPLKTKWSLKAYLTRDTIDLSHPEIAVACRAATEQLENMIGQLRAAFQSQCQRLDTAAVSQFLSLLLNHSPLARTEDLAGVLSSDFFSNPAKGLTYYGGNFHGCLSLRHNGFPGTAHSDLLSILFDPALKDIPFTLKASVTFPDSVEAKKKANAQVSRINAYSSLFGNLVNKDLLVQREKLDEALIDIEQYSGRLLDVSLVISTWSSKAETLEMNLKNVANVLRSRELSFVRDTYNHKATFFGLLPHTGHLNRITTRMPSMHVGPFLPLLFPPFYPNEKKPEVPTYVHSGHDVLMSFDVMDTRDTAWNGIVAGQSGSGKSFFTNFLIQNHMKSGGMTFILDKGGPGAGSYRNVAMNIPSGRYIELRFIGKPDFTINFFDGPLYVREREDKAIVADLDGEPDGIKENFLVKVLTLMSANSIHERIPKDEEGALTETIRLAYREHANNEGNRMSLDLFANQYLKGAHPQIFANLHKFINQGVYARFFKVTTELKAVDLYCFDLEGLDEHEDLAPIFTLVITHFAFHMCQRNPGRRKFVVVDEAWSAFKGPLVGLIENIWRTIRKHDGFIYCITQSYEDIFKSEISAALLNNTSRYFMCGASHNYEYLSQLKAASTQTNTLSEYDYECISKMVFKKGEYSETYYLCPSFKGVLRLRPCPEDYWLATTNARDKEVINQVKQQLGVHYVTPEVLERLVSRR